MIKYKFLFGLLLSGCFFNAGAQDRKIDSTAIGKAYWLEFGLGNTSVGSAAGFFGINAEIKNKFLLTAAYIGETNNFFESVPPNPIVDVGTYTLLLGKVFKMGPSLFAISTGLAAVSVTTNTTSGTLFNKVYTKNNQTTVGIPIVVKGYGVLGQLLGGGLTGYVNLNTVKTTAGFTINVALGNINTRRKN